MLRLEDGDRVPECIERFAVDRGIARVFCSLIGWIKGGQIVVGPKEGEASKIVPMVLALQGIHEVTALGNLRW